MKYSCRIPLVKLVLDFIGSSGRISSFEPDRNGFLSWFPSWRS